MGRILKDVRLNIIYYGNKMIEKMMAMAFNIDFVIWHHRRPRRASRSQVEEFRKFIDGKKGGKKRGSPIWRKW